MTRLATRLAQRLSAGLAALTLSASALFAACEGTDLIDALPAHQKEALLDRAAQQPNATGILWHAVREDTRITLFGTFHLRHAATELHLSALTPFIDAADSVYLEMSNADAEALQVKLANDPSMMFLTEGPTLPDLLGDADWARLADEFKARNIPPFIAARFKPIWAAMMLGLGPCEARSGALEAEGIDTLIGAYAAGIDKPSQSLEDGAAILRLLDDVPQEKQLDMLRLFFDLTIDADDLMYTTKSRYLSQEIALLWEYSRKVSLEGGGDSAQEDFDMFEAALLTRRNRDWVARMTSEDFTGDIFVAVGAAHLPGDRGVLNLLENKGFTVTRLPFSP
ncbi:TraB/GumN family protein [Roseovarius sp. C7]|uniref:TraB/GumN family protein n=1 Tax=Roseovarius sp. C7 TaxID=3398643 RepID=UPI0039F69E29